MSAHSGGRGGGGDGIGNGSGGIVSSSLSPASFDILASGGTKSYHTALELDMKLAFL